MGAKRIIKNCNHTYEVADLLARTIRKMPEYADCKVENCGPFGLSNECSVYVTSPDDFIIGIITIHYSNDSESGFSYGKTREMDRNSSKNLTPEKPLPINLEEAVSCVFEKKRIEEEIFPIVEGLSDSICVMLHNSITNVHWHRVFNMCGVDTALIRDIDGRELKAKMAEDFDKNAPYYVVDNTTPGEPYYFAEYELRSIYHYDELHDSPYRQGCKMTPREMLTSNLVYWGRADQVRELAS